MKSGDRALIIKDLDVPLAPKGHHAATHKTLGGPPGPPAQQWTGKWPKYGHLVLELGALNHEIRHGGRGLLRLGVRVLGLLGVGRVKGGRVGAGGGVV